MLKVALSGGIGSGKSAVCSLFQKVNVAVIDADRIAHQLVEPGMPELQRVIELFDGETIIDNSGRLNRKKLRQLIFDHSDKRKLLENILHQPVYARIDKQCRALTGAYCIISIPLLIETKAMRRFDRVLIVDAPIELRVRRIIERDASTKREVMKIIDAQATRAQRNAVADDVIINDLDLSALNEQVKKLDKLYRVLAEDKLMSLKI